MRNLAKHLPDSSGFDLKHILVEPGKPISLKKDFDPAYSGNFKDKEETLTELRLNIEQLAGQQDILYANGTYALLLVLQALDAAGKDSTIKHVMSGVNPQGCEVYSFKAPFQEELDHDYLWRAAKRLPRRGRIGIFNRSYYEEVLVVRVHPEILAKQHLPPCEKDQSIWKHRFEEINCFERYLVNNGIIVLKLFLNVSKKEQKVRFLKRIEEKEQKLEVFGRRRPGTAALGGAHGGIRRYAHSHQHRLGTVVYCPSRPQVVHSPLCLRDHRCYAKVTWLEISEGQRRTTRRAAKSKGGVAQRKVKALHDSPIRRTAQIGKRLGQDWRSDVGAFAYP